MVYAKLSTLSEKWKELDGKYPCKYDWPKDCGRQCGDSGIVLRKGSMDEVFTSENPVKEVVDSYSYTTAFFEAFPKEPSTFIRGEGKTLEEAEKAAWDKLQKYSKCDHPEFDRKGYKNGGCFCIECGMFSSHLEPTTVCTVCNIPTNYGTDKNNQWYCKEHYKELPDDMLHDYILLSKKRRKQVDKILKKRKTYDLEKV